MILFIIINQLTFIANNINPKFLEKLLNISERKVNSNLTQIDDALKTLCDF